MGNAQQAVAGRRNAGNRQSLGVVGPTCRRERGRDGLGGRGVVGTSGQWGLVVRARCGRCDAAVSIPLEQAGDGDFCLLICKLGEGGIIGASRKWGLVVRASLGCYDAAASVTLQQAGSGYFILCADAGRGDRVRAAGSVGELTLATAWLYLLRACVWL